MNLWSIDARETVKDISDIDETLIEETDGIKRFLHQDGYYFVIASKGFGKSLLLLTKRRNLKGVECVIPKNLLLDVPEVTTNISREKINFFYQQGTMQKLWTLSIAIAIIQNLGMSNIVRQKDISLSLRHLLTAEVPTVSGNFGEILRSVSRRQFFQDLIEEYNTLISFIQNINKSVAIFIDNIDECFESWVEGFGREIWYIAQHSLIAAIYNLVRLNPRFKFFAAIRKEAFLKLRQSTEMFQQYKGVTLDLRYHKRELRDIFIRNVKKERDCNLANKNLLQQNPILSFLGTESIRHGYVNEDETTFDYIYRHTLQRPRDLMAMGQAISDCPVTERNTSDKSGLDRIKRIINETGTSIANTYITEVLPHLPFKGRSDFERIFTFIDSNVINQEKLKPICMQYNSDTTCLSRDCKECKINTHIFCELYKIGLLGYVEEDPTRRGHYRQKFSLVGEKTFDDVGLLPDSSHYLIHPVLDGIVRKKNSSYKDKIDVTNIVGYDRPWKKIEEAPSHTTESSAEGSLRYQQAQRDAAIKAACGPESFSVEGPFQLDNNSARLIGKDGRSVPLRPSDHLVLKAMLMPIPNLPLGVLEDQMVATIFLRAKEQRAQEIPDYAKKVSQQFARELRRYLKKWQILDKNALIRRVQSRGFTAGTAWASPPLINASEASVVFMRQPPEAPAVRTGKKQPHKMSDS